MLLFQQQQEQEQQQLNTLREQKEVLLHFKLIMFLSCDSHMGLVHCN